MTAGLAPPYRGGGCPSPSNPSVPSGPPSSTARWPRSWCSSTRSSSGPRAGSSPAAATTRGRRCSRRASRSRCCHRRVAACAAASTACGSGDRTTPTRCSRASTGASTQPRRPMSCCRTSSTPSPARCGCAYVAIELRVDDDWVPAAASGVPVDDVLVLPLTHHGASIGRLLVASRRRGEAFSPADRALLDDVARQAGVAAHGVGLAAELQAARERLVTTREEERRGCGTGCTTASARRWLPWPMGVRPSTRSRSAIRRRPTRRWSGSRRRCAPPPPRCAASPASCGRRRSTTSGWSARCASGRRSSPRDATASCWRCGRGRGRGPPAALEVAAYRVADAALTAAATGSGRARIVLAGGGELTVRAALEPAPAADVRRTALDGMRIACADVGGTLRTLGGGRAGGRGRAPAPRRARGAGVAVVRALRLVWLLVPLSALAAGFAIFTLVQTEPPQRDGPGGDLLSAAVYASLPLQAAVAALVVTRRPRNPIGWLLAAASVLFVRPSSATRGRPGRRRATSAATPGRLPSTSTPSRSASRSCR